MHLVEVFLWNSGQSRPMRSDDLIEVIAVDDIGTAPNLGDVLIVANPSPPPDASLFHMMKRYRVIDREWMCTLARTDEAIQTDQDVEHIVAGGATMFSKLWVHVVEVSDDEYLDSRPGSRD